MSSKGKILVAYNPPTTCKMRKDYEAEKSAAESAAALAQTLKKNGWSAKLLPVSSPLNLLIKKIQKEKPDVIFNLCEGFDGNPKYEINIAAFWELMRIPYTGCSPQTLAVSVDKILAKAFVKNAGLKTPHYAVFYDPVCKSSMKFPLIVKPANEDGSIGISSKSYVRNLSELREAVSDIVSRYGGPAIAEEYIDGREFNVAVFGREKIHVLAPAEIEFRNFSPSMPKIITYEAKWKKNSLIYKNTVSVCPANIEKRLAEQLKKTAYEIYKIFRADSYARVDFRVNHKNEIFFIEFNPNPDISPSAGFRNALNAAKIPFANFAEELIKIARIKFKRN